jgi:hypothetical protein
MKAAMARLGGPDPKPYLSTRELSEVTPWSDQAIRTMMSRGVLKLGVHYFKPGGPGGRPIFCWRAIVEYIEGANERPQPWGAISLVDGTVIDVEAQKSAYRLPG